MTLYLAETRRTGYWIVLGAYSSHAAAVQACAADAAEDGVPVPLWTADPDAPLWRSAEVQHGQDRVSYRISAWVLDGGRAGWPGAEGRS